MSLKVRLPDTWLHGDFDVRFSRRLDFFTLQEEYAMVQVRLP